jgi:hypothetical protein
MPKANREAILMGFAPSNVANDINPGFELSDKLPELATLATTNQMGLELELEGDFIKVNVPKFPKPAFLGVHQPTSSIDIDVIDEQRRPQSVRQIKQAMLMAHLISADYFTTHLQTVDRWVPQSDRQAQIQTSLNVFRDLAEYHNRKGYDFPLLIENLEYPKYPASLGEIIEVADYLSNNVSVPTGIVLDVGHLWRSRRLINLSGYDHADEHEPFTNYLQSTLDAVGEHVKVFHLTGCYGEKTHLLPRLGGRLDPSLAEDLPGFDYNFRDIGATVFRFVAGRPTPPYLVNEAFGHPYGVVIQNNKDIYEACGPDK